MYASFVACLYEQLYIRIHEWYGHGHRRAVWQDEIGIFAELLDHAKDIVPSAAIQPRAVISELVYNLKAVSRGSSQLTAGPTSSISNAATMVSISTVPRIVPRGIAM